MNRRWKGVPHSLWAVLLAIIIAPPEKATGQSPTDSLRVELARLAAVVDSLRVEIDRLRGAGEDAAADDALARLRAAAQAAAQGPASASGSPPNQEAETGEFVGRQRNTIATAISRGREAYEQRSKTDKTNEAPA